MTQDNKIIMQLDSYGRTFFPKPIMEQLSIKPMDTFEVSANIVDKSITFKKVVPEKNFCKACADFVNASRDLIAGLTYTNEIISIVLKTGEYTTVKRHVDDNCDFNAAICYAFYKLGYVKNNPVNLNNK